MHELLLFIPEGSLVGKGRLGYSGLQHMLWVYRVERDGSLQGQLDGGQWDLQEGVQQQRLFLLWSPSDQ